MLGAKHAKLLINKDKLDKHKDPKKLLKTMESSV
jgi:hypothetical protein